MLLGWVHRGIHRGYGDCTEAHAGAEKGCRAGIPWKQLRKMLLGCAEQAWNWNGKKYAIESTNQNAPRDTEVL